MNMKKIILTVAASCLATFMFGQYTYTENFPNGVKKCEGSYNSAVSIASTDTKEVKAQKMANAIRTGKWTYWYENGQLAGEQYYDNNGVMTGVWKSWYNNGKPETSIDFTNDTYVSWSLNGNIFE